MTFLNVLRAEFYRLVRDRSPLFWGFVFIPLLYGLFGLVVAFVPGGRMGPGMKMDVALKAFEAASLGGNPIVQLFVAIGASAIFGGEYRYATWRLVGPRAARPSFFLAKICGFTLMAGCSLALLVAANLGTSLVPTLIGRGTEIENSVPAASVLFAMLVSLLELTAFGALVGLMAIATRSTLGAIIPAAIFSFAQAFLEAYSPPPSGPGPWLALPVYAGDVARGWAAVREGIPSPTDVAAWVSLISLSLWCVVAIGAAIAILKYQDWSRE